MTLQGCLTSILLLCVAVTGCSSESQNALANGNFESGSVGATPTGWFVPPVVKESGYNATISDSRPKEGKQCAVVFLSGQQSSGFGNIMQIIDATPYRGKKVRFRAAVRCETGGQGQAQLWFRVDRTDDQRGFFDNMGDRPITSSDWANYEIVGEIASDAASINVGMMLVGSGRAYIDAAVLELADGKTITAAPPKALTPKALGNLTAFTKLLGYVRHFHPSNAVEKVNWDAFAIAGISVAEDASNPADLATKLENLFRPIAPTVRVFVNGKKPVNKVTRPSGADQMTVWENVGFGGGTIQQNVYQSKRVFTAIPANDLPAPFEADLGSGISCVVPLALYATDGSAFPRTAEPNFSVPAGATGDDRTTRLADVALAWNVFEHFYPYFDIVKVDWKEVLRTALNSAATDPDERAFLDTLRRLVASAADGHGNVNHPSDTARALPPFVADWVENKLVITAVQTGTTKIRAGDEISRINGKAVEALWTAAESLISGATPQWRRFRGTTRLLAGPEGSSVSLELLRGSETISVDLVRSAVRVVEPRPDAIKEIKPGIWYVDLDGGRAKMEDYKKALPDLVKAKGLIFDLRGYPNDVALDVLATATPKPFISAFWNIPKVMAPGKMEFMQSNWPPAGPTEPRFKGKIAFLTDGRAISYAESVMAIVEHYKIGEIIGSTTAGTNGNVNPFKLPGGYTVVFTGMKVVRHDGKPHHGVGIAPTIPVSRTISGVRAKKDEVLEKAISVVGG